jgi:hypothetical protein
LSGEVDQLKIKHQDILNQKEEIHFLDISRLTEELNTVRLEDDDLVVQQLGLHIFGNLKKFKKKCKTQS